MQQAVLKALYAVHSWLGVWLGLLIYVICVSGLFALFTQELVPLLRNDYRSAAQLSDNQLDVALSRALATAEHSGIDLYGKQITLRLPTDYRPYLQVQIAVENSAGYNITLDPMIGEPPTTAAPVVNTILTDLHTDLLLPQPVGRYLVGALAIVMLMSIISGVLMHRKLIRELFSLRLQRSTRLKWTDLHKSIGLWGLPFHFIIALSGAVLGWAGVIVMLAAATAFEGDLGTAAAEIGAMPLTASGEPAMMRPLSELIDKTQQALPGQLPEIAAFQNYGNQLASVELMGQVPGSLAYYPSVTLNAATGEVLRIADWSRASVAKQIYAMVTPLHYASYGGLSLKIVYLLLGLGCSLLMVTGLQISRSQPQSLHALRHQHLSNTVITTVCSGLPLAMTALLLAHLLVAPDIAASRAAMIGLLLACWASCLPWTWWRGAARAGREFLTATGALLVMFPLLTRLLAMNTPDAQHVFPHPAMTLELCSLLIGMVLLAGGYRQHHRISRPKSPDTTGVGRKLH